MLVPRLRYPLPPTFSVTSARQPAVFYTDGTLQYKVRVDKPDPLFACALPDAIGVLGAVTHVITGDA